MVGSSAFSSSAAFTRTAQSLSASAVRSVGTAAAAPYFDERLERGGARVDDEIGLAALVGRDERIDAAFGLELADVASPPPPGCRRLRCRDARRESSRCRAPSASSAPSAPMERRARRCRPASASGAAALARHPSTPRIVASPARTLQCGSGSSPDSTVRNVSSSRFANPCSAASRTVGMRIAEKVDERVDADCRRPTPRAPAAFPRAPSDSGRACRAASSAPARRAHRRCARSRESLRWSERSSRATASISGSSTRNRRRIAAARRAL